MKNPFIIIINIFLAMLIFTGIAFAERNAVFFIEMEHEDSDEQALEELATVMITNQTLKNSYENFYWCINTTATKDYFMQTMQETVNSSSTVDLYILAHGGMQYFWGHYEDRIYVDDIISMKSFSNMDRLRFVYLGACHSWDLADEFIEAGAISVIGSDIKMSNFPFYPLFITNFGSMGYNLKTAVRISAIPLIDDMRISGDKYIRMKSHD